MDPIKKKRRRQIQPNKKWEKEEVLQILKYIQKERKLEKPSAQKYYKKCLEETKINATWNLMKWKVTHLRRRFVKALNWQNKVKAGLIEDDVDITNMEEKLNLICPHYNILMDIFGEKYNTNFEFYDTGSDNRSKNSLPRINVEQIGEVEMLTTNNKDSHNREQYVTEVKNPPSISKRDRPGINLKKTVPPKTAIEQLSIINKERNEILKLKIQSEKIYNERKLRLEEQKFEEEKNRRRDDFELRKQELELKKMELEKDERLKMYEIKMKYSNKDCSPDSFYYYK